jgi:hypothetical protein
MSKLIVERTSEWQSRSGKVDLYLNGSKVDSLDKKERKEFELTSDKNTLQVRMGWHTSQEIEIDLGEQEKAVYKISEAKGFNWLYLAAILSGLAYYAINFFFNQKIYLLGLIALPGILYLAYLMTFGRKKYFRLNKTL